MARLFIMKRNIMRKTQKNNNIIIKALLLLLTFISVAIIYSLVFSNLLENKKNIVDVKEYVKICKPSGYNNHIYIDVYNDGIQLDKVLVHLIESKKLTRKEEAIIRSGIDEINFEVDKKTRTHKLKVGDTIKLKMNYNKKLFKKYGILFKNTILEKKIHEDDIEQIKEIDIRDEISLSRYNEYNGVFMEFDVFDKRIKQYYLVEKNGSIISNPKRFKCNLGDKIRISFSKKGVRRLREDGIRATNNKDIDYEVKKLASKKEDLLKIDPLIQKIIEKKNNSEINYRRDYEYSNFKYEGSVLQVEKSSINEEVVISNSLYIIMSYDLYERKRDSSGHYYCYLDIADLIVDGNKLYGDEPLDNPIDAIREYLNIEDNAENNEEDLPQYKNKMKLLKDGIVVTDDYQYFSTRNITKKEIYKALGE